jgi:hypothetical protein
MNASRLFFKTLFSYIFFFFFVFSVKANSITFRCPLVQVVDRIWVEKSGIYFSEDFASQAQMLFPSNTPLNIARDLLLENRETIQRFMAEGAEIVIHQGIPTNTLVPVQKFLSFPIVYQDKSYHLNVWVSKLGESLYVFSFKDLIPADTKQNFKTRLSPNRVSIRFQPLPDTVAFIKRSRDDLFNQTGLTTDELKTSLVRFAEFIPFNQSEDQYLALATLIDSRKLSQQIVLLADKMSSGKFRVLEILGVNSHDKLGVKGSTYIKTYFEILAIQNNRVEMTRNLIIKGKSVTLKIEAHTQETTQHYTGFSVDELFEKLGNALFIAEPDSIQLNFNAVKIGQNYTIGFMGPNNKIYGAFVYLKLDPDSKLPFYKVISVFEYWKSRLTNTLYPGSRVGFLNSLP